MENAGEYTAGESHYKQWLEQNPLKQFRTTQEPKPLSRMAVGAMLGVSHMSVQMWENGTKPNEENLQAIGRLIGSTDIEAEWDAWIASAPRV